jgi:alpha-D-xyloside xylohydrolase
LDAPIDKIPLLVKAGSILPLGPVEQYTGEKPGAEIELRVYPGADADFTLYGDDGTNYDYEKGERSTIHLHWNDRKQELTIGPRQGRYPGMPMSQDFRIVVAGGTSSANGIEESTAGRVLHYNGAQIVASFPH